MRPLNFVTNFVTTISLKRAIQGAFFALSIVALFWASTVDAAVNMIANPSLEVASTTKTGTLNGLPTSWYKGGYGTNNRVLTYPVAGFDGAKAVKVDITTYTAGDAKWFFERVPAVAGEQYTFSDYYTSTAPSWVTVGFKLANGTLKYLDLGRNISASPASWTQFTKTFTAIPNTVAITVFHALLSSGSLTTDLYSLTHVDTLPPTVSLISPSGTISGSVNIAADASDESGISKVSFYIDGILFGTVGGVGAAVPSLPSPYTLPWDTTATSNGTHSLFAVARDTTGNTATSTTVSVVVNNTSPPANLTVTLSVLNDNGRTKTVSDFPLHIVTGPIVSGVATSVPPGTYSISVVSDPDYTLSFGGDCDTSGSVTLASGQSKSCTVLEDDHVILPTTGTITPNVVVVNDNGGSKVVSDFSIFINNEVAISGVSREVVPGVYTITENPDALYSTTFSGGCTADGSISVAAGENKVCTITNDDIPPPSEGTLSVSVTVTNDYGGTKHISDFSFAVDGTRVTLDTPTLFPSGVHHVSASPLDTYTATFSGDCNAAGSVTVATGSSSCIIALHDKAPTQGTQGGGSLTVSVTVINDNGGAKTVSDFPIALDGKDIFSGVATTVPAGTFLVSEVVNPTYHVSFGGDCDASGNVSVASGENKVCTITNDDIAPPPSTGKITVRILVINDNDGTKSVAGFPAYVDTELVSSDVAVDVEPGTHFITEISDPGYAHTFSGTCGNAGSVTVAAGETLVCTITNNDSPNLITNPSVEIASTTKNGQANGLPLGWYKGGYGTNNRILGYPVPGNDTPQGVSVSISTYTDGDGKWFFENVPVVGGKSYSFSDTYMANTQSYITVQYKMQDGTFSYFGFGALPATTSWQTVSKTLTAPLGATAATVFHAIKSVGNLTTDTFALREASPLLPLPHDPQNVVPNPSFEFSVSGDPTTPLYWSRNGYGINNRTFTYPAEGYDASPGAKVEITSYTSGDAKWSFNAVPVTAGEEYRLSEYYKGTASSSVSLQFALASGGYKYLDLQNVVPTTSWKRFENAFLVPSGATSMTIFHVIKGVGTLTLDNVAIRKLESGAFGQGMVSLHFDDGFESVYQNAIPILNTASLRSGQWIITTYLNDPYYVSPSQILEMSAGGHEIGTHTFSHPHLSQLSDADLHSEIFGAKATIDALGVSNTFFAYPFGDYNDRIIQVVKDAGFHGARSVHSGFNTRNSDKFALNDQHVQYDTTAGQVKQWIDEAIAHKYWLILEFHETTNTGGQYSNTPETLQAIVDYLVEKHVPVVTSSEGLNLMNP